MTQSHLEKPAPVLVLVRDLMFSSRISAAAAQTGSPVKLLRGPLLLAGSEGTRLIVDLNLAGAIEAAQAWKAKVGGDRLVIGFVSHTDTETIQRARAAGIDRVMARSQFVQLLPGLLAERLSHD